MALFVSGNKLTPARLNAFTAVAERTTAQPISNGTPTAISFDSQHFDNANMFTPPSTTITIPAGGDGVYDIEGFIPWAANATGYRTAEIQVNGTRLRAVLISPNSIAPTGVAVQCRRNLVAGNTITLVGDQTSGGPLNAGGTTLGNPGLSVRRVPGA